MTNITTFVVDVPDEAVFDWNCFAEDNRSRGGWGANNWTVNASLLVNDTHKFYVRNDTGTNVGWLGSEGNIVLAGSCVATSDCSAGANGFIIKNVTSDVVAYLNKTGDVCVSSGDCSDKNATCNPDPTTNSFLVREQGVNVSFLSDNGDMCLIGRLVENYDL